MGGGGVIGVIDLWGEDSTTEMLLLTFHPYCTFSSTPFDPADYALRSPFPTLHLLRGTDIENAEQVFYDNYIVTFLY